MSDYYREELMINQEGLFDASEDYLEAQTEYRPRIITAKEEPIEIIDLTSSPKTCHGEKDLDFERMNKEHDKYVAKLRAITLAESDHERKKELRREARRWIGAVIYKRIGDETHRGTVVDYEVKNGWFKISYEDQDHEEMSKDEVIQLLAQPESLRASFNLLPASSEKHKPKRKKSATSKYKRANNILLASAINGNLVVNPPLTASKVNQAVREQRPRRAKTRSSYVPLAVSETKKDAYYWYWP